MNLKILISGFLLLVLTIVLVVIIAYFVLKGQKAPVVPEKKNTLEFPRGAYSKLMVAAGQNKVFGDILNMVEIIDLSDPKKICTNVAQLPFQRSGVAVGLGPDGRPLICGGGSDNLLIFHNDCYGLESGSWKLYNTMQKQRGDSSSLTLPQVGNLTRMVVVGGIGGYDGFDPFGQKSFEILGDSGWQLKGNISYYSYSCISMMNENTWMLVGGLNDKGNRIKFTFIYDAANDSLTPGPDLPISIGSGVCGTVNKDETGVTKSYIVFGGSTKLQNTYILDQGAMAWRAGPKLAFEFANQAAVDDPLGGVLCIGGHLFNTPLNTIYRLAHGAAQWVQMSQVLKVRRLNVVAFMIPDDYATCS